MQSNLEQTSEEMGELRDRVKQLESENDRLKTSVASSKSLERERLVEGLALSPAQAAVKEVTEGLSSLRSKYSRSQSADNKATVKGLIDSIESAAKAKTASYTRSSSTPAMVPTLSPIAENPKSTFPIPLPSSPAEAIPEFFDSKRHAGTKGGAATTSLATIRQHNASNENCYKYVMNN